MDKKEYQALIKKRRVIHAKEAGKLLILNLFKTTYEGAPFMGSVAELQQKVPVRENEEFKNYLRMYNGELDMYNTLYVLGQGAVASLDSLSSKVEPYVNDNFRQINEQKAPVFISPSQYKRYETKHREYLKRTARKYREEPIAWCDVFLSFFLQNQSKKNATAQWLEQHGDELISSDQLPVLKAIGKEMFDDDVSIYARHSLSIGEQEGIAERYPVKSGKLEDALTNWHRLVEGEVSKLRFEQELSDAEAYRQAVKKYPYSSKWKIEIIPEKTTKKSFFQLSLEDIIFGFNNGHFAPRSEVPQAYITLFLKEYGGLLTAIKQDLLALYPKLSKFLADFDEYQVNAVLATQGELSAAGMEDYKQFATVAGLKKLGNEYGLWRVMPEKDQGQARKNGISIYMPPYKGDKWPIPFKTLYTVEHFQKFSGNDAFTIKDAYKNIELYLTAVQTYEMYLQGLALLTGIKELPKYAKSAMYSMFTNDYNVYRRFVYTLNDTLDEVEGYTDKEKQGVRELLHENFPAIDLDKARIKTSEPSKVAKYLWSQYNSNGFVTGVALDTISEGVK